MSLTTAAFVFVLTLLVGMIIGWCMRFAYDEILDRLYQEPHDLDHIFESNPHPELYDDNGNIYRGDYISADINENPWSYEEEGFTDY